MQPKMKKIKDTLTLCTGSGDIALEHILSYTTLVLGLEVSSV
jgi:hypothetical protein